MTSFSQFPDLFSLFPHFPHTFSFSLVVCPLFTVLSLFHCLSDLLIFPHLLPFYSLLWLLFPALLSFTTHPLPFLPLVSSVTFPWLNFFPPYLFPVLAALPSFSLLYTDFSMLSRSFPFFSLLCSPCLSLLSVLVAPCQCFDFFWLPFRAFLHPLLPGFAFPFPAVHPIDLFPC